MTYYIVWGDYDGERLEKYPENDSEGVEEKLTEITNRAKEDPHYGIVIHAVIHGEEVEYSPVKFVEKMQLEDSP